MKIGMKVLDEFRAMKTRRYWILQGRVFVYSGWYLLALLLGFALSVYNVSNAGFLSVEYGSYHYFLYFGVGPYFWGFLYAIIAVATLGKMRRVARRFSTPLNEDFTKRARDFACGCCSVPDCMCGDCFLCGKVLP